VVGVVVVLALVLRGDPTEGSPGDAVGAAGSSATGGECPSPGDDAAPTIELDAPPAAVEPMSLVPLTGTVRSVAPGTSLTVQSSTGAEPWTSFPLRPVVGDAGRFRTFVELGVAGVHRLRVVEPRSGMASSVVVVRVR
jgi:hypothetical protein